MTEVHAGWSIFLWLAAASMLPHFQFAFREYFPGHISWLPSCPIHFEVIQFYFLKAVPGPKTPCISFLI